MGTTNLRRAGEDLYVSAAPKFIGGADNVDLTILNRVVVLTGTTGDLDINMPPVSEAAGRIFSIRSPDVGTDTNAVTVKDPHGSVDWGGNYTIDADDDHLVLYSDGQKWYELTNGIA